MSKNSLGNLSLGRMLDYIARGHAFNKHLKGEDTNPKMHGLNAFNSTQDNDGNALGPNLSIETPRDLKEYIQKMLDELDTEGFVDPRNGSITVYSPRDNVMMHFTPNDRANDFGTIYRYHDSKDKYAGKLEEALETYNVSDTRHHFMWFDNEVRAGDRTVRSSVRDLIEQIQNNPNLFKNKPTTQLEHATFMRTINRGEDRPGRRPSDHEVGALYEITNNTKDQSLRYRAERRAHYSLNSDPAGRIFSNMDVKSAAASLTLSLAKAINISDVGEGGILEKALLSDIEPLDLDLE